MNRKITIEVFTDPMMGLSYEHEPVLDHVRMMYKEDLEIRYIMAGLVRDVEDFMNAEELSLPRKEGILQYNCRLAKIYKSEEYIGGLPIHMDGFHLFDEEHRSSYPLCIAYKAAELSDPQKALSYLYRLRLATIVETRQTTKTEELLAVAKECGIDEKQFLWHLQNGSAETAFQRDREYAHCLNIHSLPAYLIHVDGKMVLIHGLPDQNKFERIIHDLQDASVK